MSYMDQLQDPELKLSFAKTLFEATDQKIYLDAEHAKLCLFIVQEMERNHESIEAALKMMENLHVETYGSLSMKEKLQFILYQIKLNLQIGDYTKLFIVAKKITPKHLEEEGLEFAKISYYLYMYEFYKNKVDFSESKNSLLKVLEVLKKTSMQSMVSDFDPFVLNRF